MATKPPSNKPKAGTPAVLPKPAQARPGIVTVDLSTNRGKNVPLSNTYTSFVNQTIANVRSLGDTLQMVRALVRVSGDVSTALAMKVRLAHTPITWLAYSSDHQLNPEGAQLLRSILRDLDYLSDYTQGYDARPSVDSVTQTMLREVELTGGCALELVLDKLRMPSRLKPVSPSQVKWKISEVETGDMTHKIIPWQQLQGATIELDIPTFFYSGKDVDPVYAYPSSPMEPAINTAIFQAETVEDIRRVVRRSGHSRLMVTIDDEATRASAPVDVQTDPVKLQAYMESVRAQIQSQLETISPEAAMVVFKSTEAEYLNSEIGGAADYGPFTEIVDGLVSTSLRTPPSVLGKRTGGSQNVSSVESLLFLKEAASLQGPVSTVLSRALTLGMRLTGFDGYVVARFASIDLRPEHELEAFRTMQIDNEARLLSMGFRTDDESAAILGTGARAPGAPALSGTMFWGASSASGPDPTKPDGNTDPARNALTGNTPKKAGGRSQ